MYGTVEFGDLRGHLTLNAHSHTHIQRRTTRSVEQTCACKAADGGLEAGTTATNYSIDQSKRQTGKGPEGMEAGAELLGEDLHRLVLDASKAAILAPETGLCQSQLHTHVRRSKALVSHRQETRHLILATMHRWMCKRLGSLLDVTM